MAMGSGGSGNGRPGMMGEINVTPLVDVMLVLLIIFMVTAPMMTQGLDVELPKVDPSQPLQTEDQQTILTIKKDGEVWLDEQRVVRTENLAFQVQEVMKTKGTKTVFLRADKDTPYGDVATVMSQLRQAGISNVGLVTEPADRSPAAAREEPLAAPQRQTN